MDGNSKSEKRWGNQADASAARRESGPFRVSDWPRSRATCAPIPMGNVSTQGFLGGRVDMNLNSLLAGVESPIPKGFEGRVTGGELDPACNRLAADSDLYKWIEGASYVYARTGNARLKRALDRIVTNVVACQEPDGYINTQVPPGSRFDPKIKHDLYIAGHFFEAAVAHHRATGELTLLDAARRWGEYLVKEYEADNPYFKDIGKGDHPEYEIGLLRLYRETGQKEFLRLSLALTRELSELGSGLTDVRAGRGLHAVRVGYLLAGCADLYLETGAHDLLVHLPGLWQEITTTRLYVTGGMGVDENIPERPFVLPQSLESHSARDVAETCASVALMMFSWRLHSITGESRIFDVIENTLYNHYLGALDLDNMGNFYYNPLRVLGDQTGMTDHGGPRTQRTRLPRIHSTTCCITNAWRFFGALPEYLYSADDRGVYVNLYETGSATYTLADGVTLTLRVETHYPYDGHVRILVESDTNVPTLVRLRIPAWCTHAEVSVNDDSVSDAHPTPGTYLTLKRAWRPGDRIDLSMAMPVRMLHSDPRILDNAGQVAFARGPLVYALEQVDHSFPLEEARVHLHQEALDRLAAVEWQPELLGGINLIKLPGLRRVRQQRGPAYSELGKYEPVQLTFIPFYVRANRAPQTAWTVMVPLAQ